jgi:hypothetical protein
VQSWTRNNRVLIAWDGQAGPSSQSLIVNHSATTDVSGWSGGSGPGLERVTSVPDMEMPPKVKTAMRVAVNSTGTVPSWPLETTGHFESDIVHLRLGEVNKLLWQVLLSPGAVGDSGVWHVGIDFYAATSFIPDPEMVAWYSPPNLIKYVDMEGGWTLAEGEAFVTGGSDGFAFTASWARHAGDAGESPAYLYLTQCQVTASGGIASAGNPRYYDHYLVFRRSPGDEFAVVGTTAAEGYVDGDISPGHVYEYMVQGTDAHEAAFTTVGGPTIVGVPFYEPLDRNPPSPPHLLMATERKSSVAWEWFPSSKPDPEKMLAYLFYDSASPQPKYVVWEKDLDGEHVSDFTEFIA